MREVQRSALVPYSAEEIYRLVDDVEAYPEFLPWCTDATVNKRTAKSVDASLELEKAGVSKVFSTRNTLTKGRRIEMGLLDGPFNHLDGVWEFEPLSESACKVSLDIHYEFSNPVVDMLFGPGFKEILSSLVDAFVKRAREIYGDR